MGSLEGKHILVTGASSGMGKVFAQMIAAEGAVVTLLARNRDRLLQTCNSLIGGGHKVIVCDLLNDAQVMEAVAEMESIDGAVFCAGINDYVPLRFVSQSKIDPLFKTNFFSQIILTQALSKKKKIKKGASLVFISSLSSKLGVPGTLLYASSKAALDSAVRVMASELASQGIRVNSICPGIVRTEMLSGTNISEDQFIEQEKDYPLGLGTPEDVGHAVLFHLSDGSRWLTGQNMIIDGGFTLK